jgi:hypothetical protein
VLASVAVAPARASDTDRDLERVAIGLREALAVLRSDEVLRREVLWLAIDLRLAALRCALRDTTDDAGRLTEWAERFERDHANRGDLRLVAHDLQSELDRRRVRRLASELVANQDRIARAIRELPKDYSPHYDQGTVEPRIGELPLIVAEKGKPVRVRQAIQWRQHPGDTLKVTLVSSAAELVVPAELTLEFEEHSLDFEYEIRGLAVGDYTIVLVPAVGREVKVRVSVR